MKKTVTIILLAICMAMPIMADNITKLGMNTGYDSAAGKPEMGMYMTYLFIDSRGPKPVSLGFGTRVDMNATLPADRMNVDFLTGMAIDFKLKNNWGIELLAGPVFGVSTHFSDIRNESLYIGGGADLSATYYLDNERTSGINFGIYATGGVYMPEDDTLPVDPTARITGYFGFSFRSGYNPMFYGSQDIYITI